MCLCVWCEADHGNYHHGNRVSSSRRLLLEYCLNDEYKDDINTTTSNMKGALINGEEPRRNRSVEHSAKRGTENLASDAKKRRRRIYASEPKINFAKRSLSLVALKFVLLSRVSAVAPRQSTHRPLSGPECMTRSLFIGPLKRSCCIVRDFPVWCALH